MTELHLNQHLSQELRLSQETIQSLKMLTLNQWALMDYLEGVSLENPLVEVDFEGIRQESTAVKEEAMSSANDYEVYTRQSLYESRDDEGYDPITGSAYKPTLNDYLHHQLGEVTLSFELNQLCSYLIDSLDRRGFMVESIEDIAEFLQIPVEKVAEGQKIIQGLEPIGVGVYTVEESLALQLEGDALAQAIVMESLDLVARNQPQQLAKKYDTTLTQMLEVIEAIKRATPYPGAAFSDRQVEKMIVPEGVVERGEEGLSLRLYDRYLSNVALETKYNSKLDQLSPVDRTYIKDQFNSGQRLLYALNQRQKTLYGILGIIMEVQSAYFLDDNNPIAPLSMSDVAEQMECHVSTVSRGVRDKYLETPWGIKPLTYFFFGAPTQSGDASTQEVKTRLGQLIDGENKLKPYSDQALCKLLAGEGLSISRRTVAKYREELGYLSSTGRKVHS